ncbi:MAG: hypothetical protein Q4G07_00075 [Oscillospiraceae bacterium]|nr:hypothetical protein [Oscillospiraceae bacterium]
MPGCRFSGGGEAIKIKDFLLRNKKPVQSSSLFMLLPCAPVNTFAVYDAPPPRAGRDMGAP